MFWTNDQVKEAVTILGKYRRICDALPEIARKLSRRVTADSLKHAMKQRKLLAPSAYLGLNFVDNAARKMESAWFRELDETALKSLDCIRPVDGFNYAPRRTILTEQPIEHVPGSYGTISYGGKIYPVSDIKVNCDLEPVEKITKILVCPDAHFPYENKLAWKTFLEACRVTKPDVLVIIGDFCDGMAVSAHAKKATDERRFKNEVEAVNVALDQICALRIPRMIYIFGNHESRFERYLNSKAPELDGMLSLQEEFRLAQRNIEYVAYGDFIKIGEMSYTHDVGRCGINTARQSLSDFGSNLIVGHSHRAAVVYGGTVEGETHVCMNVGHLLNIDDIDYRNRHTAKREWQTGFGICYQTEDGVNWVTFVPIIDGRCIVDGKIVNVR